MMVTEYDVVVVGAGPAGLMFSSCLSRWGHKIKHIDKSATPTMLGKADGIQPRSLELFRNLGLKSTLMAQHPYRIYKIATWTYDATAGCIKRSDTHIATPKGVRYPFVAILGQPKIEQILLAQLEKQSLHVDRPFALISFEVDPNPTSEYPVAVKFSSSEGGIETVKSKYLIGADGARSLVRRQLGIGMEFEKGLPYNVWGVIDGEVTTDFPDIKMMCNLAGPKGTAMLVPREEQKTRLYIYLDTLPDEEACAQFAAMATESFIKDRAQAIFSPYRFHWKVVNWCSTYPVRQGVASRYTSDERVFIIGDACHVHSPKAGQGMNNGFLDAQNLAWKINLVERQLVQRRILETYESERQSVARTLISFDREYAAMFSKTPAKADHAPAEPNRVGVSSRQRTKDMRSLSQVYQDASAFLSGYGVTYPENILNRAMRPELFQDLSSRTRKEPLPGHLFVSSRVTGVKDGIPVRLEHAVLMDGLFRIFVFAGNPRLTGRIIKELDEGLSREPMFTQHVQNSLSFQRTESVANHNGPFALCVICTIYAVSDTDDSLAPELPSSLALSREHLYMDEAEDAAGNVQKNTAHWLAGATAAQGNILVVRPDGYIATRVSLAEDSAPVDVLKEYFSGFCT